MNFTQKDSTEVKIFQKVSGGYFFSEIPCIEYINDMFIHKKITNRFFLNADVLDFKHFSDEGTRLVTCNLNDVLA